MKKFKGLKAIAFIVFAFPLVFLLSACGGGGLKTFTGLTFTNQTVDYNGSEHEIVLNGDLPEGTSVEYENNKATNAGEYSAKVTISLEGYETLILTATLKINKLTYDMTNAKWNYTEAFTYNGSEQGVEVTGLPQGVTVKEYQNNRNTNAGEYTASVEFNYDTINHNEPVVDNLNWKINKASYDMTNAKWNYTEAFTYNGSEQGVEVIGLPQGVTVKEYQNNIKTNAGEYTASVEFNYDTINHNEPVVDNLNWKINKATYDMTNAKWNYTESFTYNGSEQGVEVIGLPQGVTVKEYQNNRNTNAGEYTASVEFNYDTTNYNEPVISNLNWIINKLNFTGITFSGKTVEYDSLEHSIELIGNIPTNSIVRITYNDNEVSGVREVGEYNVKLVITNQNYNTYETSVVLKIVSTEERLYSVVFNGNLYFQNNLDRNKLYKYDGTDVKKVNNDIAQYFTINGNNLYYYSSSLFSKVIKSYNGTTATTLIDVNGEYITCDGTYIYYAINNLLKTSDNGIYKVKLDGSEASIKLVSNKAEYLTYYNEKIYYSNVSDGRKLYSIETTSNGSESGTLLHDEKVSDIIVDNGVLYFNSTKTQLGIGVASAIKKYNISTGTCVKLTTDNGMYLTKVGSYIYYVNKDKITSSLFGDGLYCVSALGSSDSNMPGTKVLSTENNGFSSLSSNGNCLYYYKLNDKHLYSYNLSTKTETDLMSDFVVEEETVNPTGYVKLAEYNNEIYYTNPLDCGCLYKYNILTKASYKVLSDSVSNVYFYNGYMYYSTYILTNYALWRMDLLSNISEKISSSRCDNLIFDNETIYYVKVGSAYNNHIMKMDLDGSNVVEIYSDKNLWVASFEKVNENIYFTINPMVGKKYVYKYNITTGIGESLGLRSNYMTIENGVMYYFNIEDNTICSYNLTTQEENVLVENVDVNNMILSGNILYYSTIKSGNIGLYQFNVLSRTNTKISDKCADGMIVLNNKLYFIQTAISYTSDYPTCSNGDGNLYCYDGSQLIKL